MKDKFLLTDGMVDIEALEEWAEAYYQGLIKMMNGFYARADMKEVFDSMQAIPFDKLVAQELADASTEVIEAARSIVGEIAERELEYLKSYLGRE